MEKVGEKKITSLMKLTQERLSSKKTEKEVEKIRKLKESEDLSCPLTDDCVSSILVRLPICSLQRSRIICKPWYNMLHNSVLIHDHVLRSELVILFQAECLSRNKDSDFSVESSVVETSNLVNKPQSKNPLNLWERNPLRFPYRKTYIQFMDYVDGEAVTRDFNISCLGLVIGSCNGLLLIEYKLVRNTGLVVMNPVTRQSLYLHFGTLSPRNRESYGFAYDTSTKQYKVIHLFNDVSGHTSCEIMVVGAKNWKMVDGPSFGLVNWFGYRPVSAIGALHWLPQKLHNEYIVSMEIEKESFKTIELPASGGIHDRIAELGDMLCFLSHEGMFMIHIWVLKSLYEETWTRFRTITPVNVTGLVPISGSRSGGQIIFFRKHSFYIYDFSLERVFTIKMGKDVSLVKNKSFLPHVNSLVSWSA